MFAVKRGDSMYIVARFRFAWKGTRSSVTKVHGFCGTAQAAANATAGQVLRAVRHLGHRRGVLRGLILHRIRRRGRPTGLHPGPAVG